MRRDSPPQTDAPSRREGPREHYYRQGGRPAVSKAKQGSLTVRWCDEGEPMNPGALTKESTALLTAATRTRFVTFPVLLLHPRHGSTWEGHERLEHFLLLPERVTAPLNCDEARRESEPKRETRRARAARAWHRLGSSPTSVPLLRRSCCVASAFRLRLVQVHLSSRSRASRAAKRPDRQHLLVLLLSTL